MKSTIILVAVSAMLAGCNSTSTVQQASLTSAGGPSARSGSLTREAACDQALEAEAGAAILEGALGVAGSFAGFGSHGAMVASHVAATAGTAISAHQAAGARRAVERNCY